MYQVTARDAAGTPLGRIPWITLQATVVFCGVGTWKITLDPNSPKAALLAPGGGIIIRDTDIDAVLCSGLITSIMVEVPEPSGNDPVVETLTVSGVTDDFWASARLIYPDPTQPATSQTAAAYDTRSGIAETVLRALVNANAGPGALLARRVPDLQLEPVDLGRGAAIKTSARFDRLSDVLTAGSVAGGLGWRIVHNGTAAIFEVYEPVDRSAEVRFSRGVGNLRAHSYSVDAPTATRAIVAGQGEGTARTIVERGLAAAETTWGMRLESFVDRRDTNDLALLAQAGDESLADTGPTAGLSISPIDIPRIRYGRDYRVGDTVSVTVGTAEIVDVVRKVTLVVDANGPRVRPLVGTDNEPLIPKSLLAVSKLIRRIGQIERRR